MSPFSDGNGEIGIGPGRRSGNRSASALNRIAMAGAALLVIAVLVVLGMFGRETFLYIALGATVHPKYGFSVGTPIVRAGPERVEVIQLLVKPGGLFAQAGVRDGDILLDRLTIVQLYERLNAPRGAAVGFHVVPGGDGAPIESRPRRRITVISPG